MNKKMSKWIDVEQNKWMFLFPWFGLSSFWKCPWSHTSTQSQSLADRCLTLGFGTGPACLACWATGLLPKAVLPSMPHNATGTNSRSGQAMLSWIVEPLVAGSPAASAVMVALCQGCGRKAGRSWGRAPGGRKNLFSAKHFHAQDLHWLLWWWRAQGRTPWDPGSLHDLGQVMQPLRGSVSHLPGSEALRFYDQELSFILTAFDSYLCRFSLPKVVS